ncbi:glycoside hydrolase N-terminal domain-containing protein [Streptomyces sp. NPDC003035]|uniref:glycosyl hydrolase family 95 catalytic domain-containing protein n=1 Tax=Streptomyces sp. NPDC003035 TaxID=3364676 RepID=UPI003692DB3B
MTVTAGEPGPVHGTWEAAPAARWEDAFLSGNGRHGAMVLGDPDDDRVIVTHHALVRPNNAEEDTRPPRLADELPGLQDRLLAGDVTAAERFTDGRPLRWVRPFHPAFQVRLRREGGGTARGYRRAVDYTTGVVTSVRGPRRSEVVVSRADDVVLQYVTAPGPTVELHLDHRLPGVPPDLTVGRSVALTPDGVLLTLRMGYPGSRLACTGVTLAVTGGGRTVITPAGVRFVGARALLVLTRVRRHEGELDAVAEAEELRALLRAVETPKPPGRDPAPTGRDLATTGTPLVSADGGLAATGRGATATGGDLAAPGWAPAPTVRDLATTGGDLAATGEHPVAPDRGPAATDGDLAAAGERPAATGRHSAATDRDLAAVYARLLDRHTALHRPAYARVTLDLAADPAERALPGTALLRRTRSPALLERLFAAGRYHLLSASGMLPPRLTGLWTGDWNTAWSGAFTTNANLNLQTASAVAADLPEVTEAHARLIMGQLADWRDNARSIFGTRGIVAPSHTDGVSGHTYHFSREYPLHLWTAGADWLLKPLVDHDESRGTRDPRLAAALAEVADFYEDFLTRTGPDGSVVVVPSYSPENRPARASWGAINATMDLTAARHALLTAAAYHPGPAADRRRALADRLPPYRINDDGALAEWAWPGLDDTYDHRHLSHLYAVWPLDEINPYDTPEPARAAHRALALRGAENDSAHGHLHQALVAARLRDGSRAEAALHRVLAGDYFHDSLMSSHYPGRDVYNADAAHALPALLVEMVVQSTPDRLVLLPAPPAAYPSGRITGIRTRFGARVDLTWGPGTYTAVVRPTRSHRIDLRSPAGAHPLDLCAGVDRVLTPETR